MVNLVKLKEIEGEFFKCLEESSFRSQKFSSLNSFFDSFRDFESLDVESDVVLECLGFFKKRVFIKRDSVVELNFVGDEFSVVDVEFVVEEGVNLILIENVDEKFVWKRVVVNLKDKSSCDHFVFVLNGKYCEIKSNLGFKSNYKLNQVFLLSCDRCFLKSKVLHKRSKSKSYVLVCGGVEGKCEVVNDGIVEIEKKSEDTEAKLELKNYLLSDVAKVFTEPVLMVKNKKVVCSHSCFISKLSEEILFYINSRGISCDDAVSLVLKSMFLEAVFKIQRGDIRDRYIKKFE